MSEIREKLAKSIHGFHYPGMPFAGPVACDYELAGDILDKFDVTEKKQVLYYVFFGRADESWGVCMNGTRVANFYANEKLAHEYCAYLNASKSK